MEMMVGERVIVAEIKAKDEARKIYEAAKKQGYTAGLVEQHRPNIFQMNVANIAPGETVAVDLHYTEHLLPEAGVYEFVSPGVVGPRYTGPSGSAMGNGAALPTTVHAAHQNAVSPKWSMNLSLNAGMPVAQVASPTHAISTLRAAKNVTHVRADGAAGGNRDFVLRYRLSGNAVQSSVLLYPGQDENYFLLTMQPPKRVERDERPPQEIIFIVDVSGSMHGFPLNTTKAMMEELLSGMDKNDRFNVLYFAGSNWALSDKSVAATPKNVRDAIQITNFQQGGGGTQLLPAMKRALSMPRQAGMSTSFVILTDGYVSVERETFDVIRENLGRANLFSFGIGSSVNRHLIEGMARAGMGEPFVVMKPNEAEENATRFTRMLASPVLTDIQIAFDGLEVYDVVPKRAPDLFAEKPVVVFGKYKGKPNGEIRLTARGATGSFSQTVSVGRQNADRNLSALKYLWARHKIASLEDERRVFRDAGQNEAIKALGLRYHLMTEFTSFVAVDRSRKVDNDDAVSVDQPLALPDGVSANMGTVGGKAKRSFLSMKAPASPAPMAGASSNALGQSYGVGGLGLRGSGRGGGGSAYGYGKAAESKSLARPADKKEMPRQVAPKVRAGQGTVKGALSKSVILRVIRHHQTKMQRCYEKALKKDASLQGTLKLTWTIDKNGRVQNVQAVGGSLTDAALKQCAVHVIRRLRFPKPSGGGEVKVTYPFAFKP
jgi:Ca-activated chloride channel family protein